MKKIGRPSLNRPMPLCSCGIVLRDIRSKHCWSCAKSIPIDERFWKYVNKTPTCWLWTGSTNDKGYGRISFGGKSSIPATHYVYSKFKGIISEGYEVCHSCDVPTCVNPDHLWLGTHAENMRDSVRKKRIAVGERNKRSKLNWEAVNAIRSSYPCLNKSELSRKFGVGHTCIRQILSGKTWRG